MKKTVKKKVAKKTIYARVVIKSKKPDKLPDFGLGKGVLIAEQLTFSDPDGRGFDSPMFQATLLEHEDRLLNEAVEVHFTDKKPEKKKR